MNDKKIVYCDILNIALLICVVFFGMYYEFCGAVFTPVLAGICFWYRRRHRGMKWKATLGSGMCAVFLLGSVTAIFFAVDVGMAFLGIARVLWIVPFLLLYQQQNCEQKRRFFRAIPRIAAAITVIGLAGIVILPLKEVFWVNHRLGGTFQYPNTFAVFLLTGVIILLYEESGGMGQALCFGILCIGIAASGSRIAMVMSVFVIGTLLIVKKRWRLCGIFLALVTVGAIYIFAAGDTDTIGRILRLSLSESTFTGRLLYAYDALGLLARHPFGMGYMGYYYAQSMIQTGVYTVRYVHNDLLQIGLDIGWIPMLAYVWAVCRCVLGRELSAEKKWIVLTVFVHGLFDFDLSYTVMMCLMLVIMNDVSPGKAGSRFLAGFQVNGRVLSVMCAAMAGLCIYIAVPAMAEYCSDYELAADIYPWHTEAKLHLLSESDDIDEVERLADQILKQNDTCALACYGKAYTAYCRDDYREMISFQKKCIARDYFNYEQYVNYAAMLCDGIRYANDETMRRMCRKELKQIPALLEQAKQKLSYLGARIADQPVLEVDGRLEMLLEEGKDADDVISEGNKKRAGHFPDDGSPAFSAAAFNGGSRCRGCKRIQCIYGG